jgi:hypothetical protein
MFGIKKRYSLTSRLKYAYLVHGRSPIRFLMNLLWVACISGFVLLEKITSGNQLVSRLGGLLFIGWAAWIVFGSNQMAMMVRNLYSILDRGTCRRGFTHFFGYQRIQARTISNCD